MISLQTLLATNIIHKIPLIAVVAFSVILAIAFIVGMVKGFRKVSWSGFFWLLAGVGFIFAYKYLYSKNPFDGKLSGKIGEYESFIWAVGLALGCILVSLVICGVCAAIFRPREVWVRDYGRDKYGFEYEMDGMDDETVGEYPAGKKLILKGNGKPCFFSRLMGGINCVLNVATVLAVITAIFLLLVNCTKLNGGKMGEIFDVKAARIALKYTKAYALDFLTIGMILGIAYGGYKLGFVGSARSVLAALGIVCVIGFAFAIPFINKLSSEIYVVKVLINRCGKLFANLDKTVGDIQLSDLCTKLLAGALMAIVGVLIILLIRFLLGKLEGAIENATVVRVIDGILAMILFLAIGTAVAALFWGVLYLLDYCGIFYVTQTFNEDSSLSIHFFEAAEELLKEIADKYLLKYAA